MATEDWKLSVCKHETSSSETIGRVYGVGFHLVMAIDRRVDRIRRHYAVDRYESRGGRRLPANGAVLRSDAAGGTATLRHARARLSTLRIGRMITCRREGSSVGLTGTSASEQRGYRFGKAGENPFLLSAIQLDERACRRVDSLQRGQPWTSVQMTRAQHHREDGQPA